MNRCMGPAIINGRNVDICKYVAKGDPLLGIELRATRAFGCRPHAGAPNEYRGVS